MANIVIDVPYDPHMEEDGYIKTMLLDTGHDFCALRSLDHEPIISESQKSLHGGACDPYNSKPVVLPLTVPIMTAIVRNTIAKKFISCVDLPNLTKSQSTTKRETLADWFYGKPGPKSELWRHKCPSKEKGEARGACCLVPGGTASQTEHVAEISLRKKDREFEYTLIDSTTVVNHKVNGTETVNNILKYFYPDIKFQLIEENVAIEELNYIHFFMDAGPMFIKTLVDAIADASDSDKQLKTNIIHTMTPATACDSAGLKRCQAFLNTIKFMTPFEPGSSKPSVSSIFDTTIISNSDIFDENTPDPGFITINENQPIKINKSSTSVSTLAHYIVSDEDLPDTRSKKSGGLTPAMQIGRIIKGKREAAFDIKRAADSDQPYHLWLIVKNHKDRKITFKYAFFTIDKICALIASTFYGLNTVLQGNKSVKEGANTKVIHTYTVWKEHPRAFKFETPMFMNLSFNEIIESIPQPVPAMGGDRKNIKQWGGEEKGIDDYYPEVIMRLFDICSSELRTLIYNSNPHLVIRSSLEILKINKNNPDFENMKKTHNKLYGTCSTIVENSDIEEKIKEMTEYETISINTNDDIIDVCSILESEFGSIEIGEQNKSIIDTLVDSEANSLLKIIYNFLENGLDPILPPQQPQPKPKVHPTVMLSRITAVGLLGEIIQNTNNPETSLIFLYFFNTNTRKGILRSHIRTYREFLYKDTLLKGDFDNIEKTLSALANVSKPHLSMTRNLSKLIFGGKYHTRKRSIHKKRRHKMKTRRYRR